MRPAVAGWLAYALAVGTLVHPVMAAGLGLVLLDRHAEGVR